MRLHLFVLLALSTSSLYAEKKPVTLEALTERGGGRGAGGGGAPVWAPDGRRFAFTLGRNIMLYDVPSKSQKELVSLELMDAATVAPPEAVVFDWQNRRVTEDSFQWSASGKEMLIERKGDLFLYHLDVGKWDQLTATAIAERDPKLSPDGKRVAFRRDHDLYTLDVATKAVTRLTHDGAATLLNGELDWVIPRNSTSEPRTGGRPIRNASPTCSSTRNTSSSTRK